MAKNGFPPVFSCTSCATASARSGSQRSVGDQLPEMLSGKRRQPNLFYASAGALDGVELAPQRMAGIDAHRSGLACSFEQIVC
jgi:hypothetical protein